jgi:hypothetical protein
MVTATHPGAQTERRAVPGRWGGLLGSKDPTGRFVLSCDRNKRLTSPSDAG